MIKKISDLRWLKVLDSSIFFVLAMFTLSCYLTIFQQANSQESVPKTTDSNLDAGGSSSVNNNNNNNNNTNSNAPETLGITLGNLTYQLTDLVGSNNATAIIVTDVNALTSPSAEAGIAGEINLTQIDEREAIMLPGDVLLKMDDFWVNKTSEITSVVEEKNPGDTLDLTLVRNQSLENRTITLVAQDIQTTDFIERFSGIYVDPETGFQMDLPQGWTGFKWAGTIDFGIASPNILNLSDIGKQNVSITISIADLPLVQNTTSQTNRTSVSVSSEGTQQIGEIQCNTLFESFGTLNNIFTTLDSVNECNISGNYSKLRSSVLATEQELITITLSANSAELYDANLAEFEKSLSTLKVNNPIDIRTVFTDLFGVGNNNQTALEPRDDINTTASSLG